MKTMFENKYVKSHQFGSKEEFITFFANQEVAKKLLVEGRGGKFWHCYVGYDSLTSDKLFVIGFDGDTSQEELNFLYWSKCNLIVFDNGNEVFIVNWAIELIARYAIITPLIGFHVTNSNSLLILEEAAMKLISQSGEILKHDQFDLLDNYYISGNQLHITMMNSMDKVIELL